MNAIRNSIRNNCEYNSEYNSKVPEGVQQTNGRVAQVGTGKGLDRCFDLLSCVCVHGYICVFSSVSCSALFLR